MTRVFGVCNLDLYREKRTAGTFKMPTIAPAAVPVPARLIPFNVAMRLNRVPANCGVRLAISVSPETAAKLRAIKKAKKISAGRLVDSLIAHVR